MEHDLENFLFSTGLPTLVGRLLYKRGIKTQKEARLFLYGTYQDLSSPFLFRDMERAVQRIKRAIKNKELILILGDYDVDGVTATALLVKGLSSLGAKTSYLIPNRFSQGYGAKLQHVEEIKGRGASLVITVDNGIKSFDFAEALRQEGIDLIITDHHLPASRIPEALAVLDPFLENGVDKSLAGVGVAFKLLQALLMELKMEERALPYLKMVAIGTVADMMEILRENRIMVKEGLSLLNGQNSYGLRILLGEAGLSAREITPRDVAIKISPRINAAGRMLDAEIALRLLLSSSEGEAREMARKLTQLNRDRQREEARVIREAKEMLGDCGDSPIIFLHSRGWNRGVLGIAALRLSRIYKKPAFVFSVKEGIAYGSGRAPDGVSLPEVLSPYRELMESFGGHATAVGITLREENLGRLKSALEEALKSWKATEEKGGDNPEETDFHELKNSLNYLRLFPPFGTGNPEPYFFTREVEVVQNPSPAGNGYRVLLSQRGVIFPTRFRRGDLLNKFRKGEKLNFKFHLDLKEGGLVVRE